MLFNALKLEVFLQTRISLISIFLFQHLGWVHIHPLICINESVGKDGLKAYSSILKGRVSYRLDNYSIHDIQLWHSLLAFSASEMVGSPADHIEFKNIVKCSH